MAAIRAVPLIRTHETRRSSPWRKSTMVRANTISQMETAIAPTMSPT